MIVLDASALLANFLREPGSDAVAKVMHAGVVMSAVNLVEVYSVMLDRGVEAILARDALQDLNCEIVPLDEALAMAAGDLRLRTRSLGLSLADRACLALAAARGLPVLTADRSWAALDVGVEVQLIR